MPVKPRPRVSAANSIAGDDREVDRHGREDDDYAELIAASPAVGFLSKADLSADAIQRLLT